MNEGERKPEPFMETQVQTLLSVAAALFAGLLMTRLFVKFHLPDVTAYLVAGVLIGPCVLGRLGIGLATFEDVDSLSLINDVALGFIAFAIESPRAKISVLGLTAKPCAKADPKNLLFSSTNKESGRKQPIFLSNVLYKAPSRDVFPK